MIEILPAILAVSEEAYEANITKVNETHSLQGGWVHIDFMDNIFVQNKSIEPVICSKHPTPLKKEAHLMVAHPLDWMNKLEGFDKVIVHIEALDDINKCIEVANNKGIKIGLAIKNETPIDKLGPFMDKIDLVLIMCIIPGFQGQPFILESLDRIKEVSALRSKNNQRFITAGKNNQRFMIGVDGHIDDQTISQVIKAGAEHLVIGSFLLKGDIDANLEKIWETIRVT